MTIPDEWYEEPLHVPEDRSKWVRGPIGEATRKLKAMRAGAEGTGAATQKRDRVGQLERQVAELRRELDEMRESIVAAIQAPSEPAAAGE